MVATVRQVSKSVVFACCFIQGLKNNSESRKKTALLGRSMAENI
jgi:hypothetical protein